MSGVATVTAVTAVREEIDYANAEVAEALAALVPSSASGRGQAFRLPLAPTRLIVELRGVPTATANALRRVLAGEMRGCALTFDHSGLTRQRFTDPFMLDDSFVRTRLRMIPLRPGISAAAVRTLRWALEASNPSENVLTVFAGDLVLTEGARDLEGPPLFNPTHEIAFLQPGACLSIHGIRLQEGAAALDAAYAVTSRASLRPLDLAEHPRAATHAAGGAAADESGFVESSFVADPRAHRVMATIPAAPGGRAPAIGVAVEACTVILDRLRTVQGVLEAAMARPALDGAGLAFRCRDSSVLITPGPAGIRGALSVKNETDTIGNLLARTIFEMVPDIGYVGYTCVPHERQMVLTVEHSVSTPHELLREVFLRATALASATFDRIRGGIRASRGGVEDG
jgi:DNA-directed RNA polymerase subunit L